MNKKLLYAVLLTLFVLIFPGCGENKVSEPPIAFSDEPGIYSARFKLKLNVSDEVA